MGPLADLIRWSIAYAASGFWAFVAVVVVLLLIAWVVAAAASWAPIRISYTREADDGQ